MAVALYARVSTTRQADNDLSIPDQLNQMREWCQSHGFAIAQEYIEPGASATDDKRPIFQQMMREATLSTSPYEAIIIHSQSRFFRNSIDFGLYERELNKSEVKLISITQPTSEDSSGDMIRKIYSVFDEFQSKETAKHTLRTMKENASQGFFNGAKPPFGFQAIETEQTGNRGRKKKKLITHEDEAILVKRIYDLYIHGDQGEPLGMKNIAAKLNQQGITKRGSQFSSQKIQEILSDETYIGHYYFNRRYSKTRKPKPREEWIRVNVEPIIDKETFARARRKRDEHAPGRVATRLVNSPVLLTGLIMCGHCGARMTTATGKSGQYRYYKCTTKRDKGKHLCNAPNLPMEKMDKLVLERLANKILHPSRVEKMLIELQAQIKARNTEEDEQLKTLHKRINANKTRVNNLYDAVEQGFLPMDESLVQRSQKLKAERENLLPKSCK